MSVCLYSCLVIWHPNHIFSVPHCHLWPVSLYCIFPHYLTRHFHKKVTEHKIGILIFCTTSVWNISHSKKNPARYHKHMCLHTKSYFSDTLHFADKFSKHPQIPNFIKIHSVGSKLLHAKRRTDRHDNTNSYVSKFCKVTKNMVFIQYANVMNERIYWRWYGPRKKIQKRKTENENKIRSTLSQ
jgi:hypothetical protein